MLAPMSAAPAVASCPVFVVVTPSKDQLVRTVEPPGTMMIAAVAVERVVPAVTARNWVMVDLCMLFFPVVVRSSRFSLTIGARRMFAPGWTGTLFAAQRTNSCLGGAPNPAKRFFARRAVFYPVVT